MTYWPRFEFAGAVFHVTAHAVGEEPLYRTPEDRRHFDRILAYTSQRLGLQVLMLCQMTDHYHALLQTPEPNLAQCMHRLHSTYSRGYNVRHGRRGHLFRERYRCWFVQTEQHFFRTVRYIALNPPRAGLCSRPERYPWSTYGRMIRAERTYPANAAHVVISRFGGVDALVAYVEEGLRLLEPEPLDLAA